MQWLSVVLIFLATYRGTRLVTRDKLPLIDLPREAFVQRWGVYTDAEDKKTSINGKRTNLFMRSLAYLWECDWCMSVWIGAAIVYGCTWFMSVPSPWLVWAAASAVTGLLTTVEMRLDKD